MNRILLIILLIITAFGVWVALELPNPCSIPADRDSAGTSVGDAGGSEQTRQPILHVTETQQEN